MARQVQREWAIWQLRPVRRMRLAVLWLVWLAQPAVLGLAWRMRLAVLRLVQLAVL